MENERTRSKGSCCVCAAWLLRLLLLLLDYVWLTGALTRADHGLVGTALVRYIVSLVYQHLVRIIVVAATLVLLGEPRYKCLLAEVQWQLASLLSLVLISIYGVQRLFDQDTSLCHVNESLLSNVDKVLYCFMMLIQLRVELDKVL